ncbi:MBL fold metallo-hydrolase [Pontiella agarivorans]|uniref:MBL fold metallo-hydrolase n=1 Tax=Pontiella agarivorans TaxID=3038953 RepID=A0ABU5MUG6_9BACT|nr:MBL fold metallo-hydrolase [Pontiella agarivorans]MDZ8117861.1 MBL fold metallo-hydrolase [Pontiella agarivorans]
MNIQPIPTGAYQEMCYLVWGTDRKTLVFDPGDDADHISQCLEQHDLEVAAYVLTHTHYDHINALADLYDLRPAPIYVHSKDWEWAFDDRNQSPPYYPRPRSPETDNIHWLETSKNRTIADLNFQCLETPGHTPGGCCLLFPEGRFILTGDTLFKGSCGRTDLPGGNPREMKNSLKKLQQLPDEIQIFPGHGENSTIGHEKATNFFMQ